MFQGDGIEHLARILWLEEYSNQPETLYKNCIFAACNTAKMIRNIAFFGTEPFRCSCLLQIRFQIFTNVNLIL